MKKRISKAVSGFLAGVLCVSAFSTNAFAQFKGDFDVREVNSGYAVAGIRNSAVQDGEVVIPDEIEGIPVTQLGSSNGTSTFLGQNEVTKLVIGKNVSGATTTAFYEAEELKEIEVHPENKGSLTFDKGSGVLSATSGGKGIIIKYLSTNEKRSYKVPDGTVRIFNMDHARFDTLDLNQVTSLEHITFADTQIDTLMIGDATVRESPDILYGASVGKFDASGSTIYGSDGKALWQEGRLIKIAKGADFSAGYFDRFDSISPYAFHSIAEYKRIEELLPERLIKDLVFSFYNQNAAVFMVNHEISFCYNYNLGVPTNVGNALDYFQSIDEEKYEKVKALMYVGVPYNGTGLFEQIFGADYQEVSSDTRLMEYGDAALNAVSLVLYETLDGVTPNRIRGVGHGIFTEEKVMEYISCLRDAVNHCERYHFTPQFSIGNGTLSFYRAGDGYESEEFTVDTVNGEGNPDPSYVYTIHITTPGMRVKETGETSFKTGTKISLVSEAAPSEISITYEEPSLKYYTRTSDQVQDVLSSAMKESQGELAVTIMVDDLLISKQDAATGEELPGAKLILTKDGREVEQWISGDIPHAIKNPEDGIYKLTELTAPDGYEIAETITFEVKGGTVPGGKVVMYDRPIPKEIQISKQDLTTGQELPGAELTLSKGGTIVETWISGDSPHVIKGLENGIYVLTEVTAPKGYEIAESITFEVVDGAVADGVVVMKDKIKEATPSDATPPIATPSVATPSEPEKPDKPGEIVKPDIPKVEVPVPESEKLQGGSGGGSSSTGHRHSKITGSSTSGPGVQKPEEMMPNDIRQKEPVPIEIPRPGEYTGLPKTGDHPVVHGVSLLSFFLMIIVARRRKGSIRI